MQFIMCIRGGIIKTLYTKIAYGNSEKHDINHKKVESKVFKAEKAGSCRLQVGSYRLSFTHPPKVRRTPTENPSEYEYVNILFNQYHFFRFSKIICS